MYKGMYNSSYKELDIVYEDHQASFFILVSNWYTLFIEMIFLISYKNPQCKTNLTWRK